MESRNIDVCLISNSYYGYYLVPWLRREFPDMAIIDYVHMEEMYWRAGGYGRTSMAMGDFLEKTYVCNHATRRNFVENLIVVQKKLRQFILVWIMKNIIQK